MNPVIQLEGLVKHFGAKKAVDGISLQMAKGKIVGLLGPNGAGKTTIIRMVMNIIAPDSGSVSIYGAPFSEDTKDRIGYLPEERGLYRKLKVLETLVFFGELKRMPRQQIKSKGMAMLEEFNLAKYHDKKVEELSKGMAQKLQFITTILHEPELLILDEPFSGLDPVNIELVKNIILKKKKEGTSIIFSTHLMDYAEKIVDGVIMINDGNKVLDGSLRNIKAAHGRNLIRSRLSGDCSFIQNLDYVKTVSRDGNEVEIELTDMKKKDELIKKLVSHCDVYGFHVSEPSLNNIFLSTLADQSSGEAS